MADGGDEESRGLALMEHSGRAIVGGVERLAADWVVAQVVRTVEAWGGLDDTARDEVAEQARAVGDAAAARVAGELRELFGRDPAAQRSTPLELVRRLRHDVTRVLVAAGVPEVVRDEFEVRSFPDDVYGVVPRSLADLGDEDLGHQLLAWGVGKATVLRARAADVGPSDS